MAIDKKKLGEDQLGSFELGVSTYQGSVTTEGSANIAATGTQIVIPSTVETKLGEQKLGSFTLGEADTVTQSLSFDGSSEIHASRTQVVIPNTTETKLGEQTLGLFTLGDTNQVKPVSIRGGGEVDSKVTKVTVDSVRVAGSGTLTPRILRVKSVYTVLGVFDTETEIGGQIE